MKNPLDTQSQLQFHSVGIVATNKELSEHFVEIIPIEFSTFMSGEILDHAEEYETNGEDYHGKSFDVKIDTTVSLRAKWLPLGQTNRITPPDIRRGEQVLIYKFGDVDEYWWVDMMQYKHIRRLETVIWAFSNNREENIEDDPESTYWVEMSTHKKIIHIHTSKNDDEPFIYDIQINTKDGRIVIQDDDLNYIFLDSAARHIRVHNKDSSYIEMDKRVINIHSLDEINMTTNKYKLVAKESMIVKTKKYEEKCDDYTVEATKSYKIETKDHKVSNDEYQIYTKKNYRHHALNGVYFETPKWEYKVDKIKFKIKQNFHAEVGEVFELSGPIMHDNVLTTLVVVEGGAVVPPVVIELSTVNEPDIEVKDPTPLKPVH